MRVATPHQTHTVFDAAHITMEEQGQPSWIEGKEHIGVPWPGDTWSLKPVQFHVGYCPVTLDHLYEPAIAMRIHEAYSVNS
jgi:hypothetical protein